MVVSTEGPLREKSSVDWVPDVDRSCDVSIGVGTELATLFKLNCCPFVEPDCEIHKRCYSTENPPGKSKEHRGTVTCRRKIDESPSVPTVSVVIATWSRRMLIFFRRAVSQWRRAGKE